MTLKIMSGTVENDIITFTVLKKPCVDPEVISLALLDPSTWVHTQKLQTPSIGGFNPSLKESMAQSII